MSRDRTPSQPRASVVPGAAAAEAGRQAALDALAKAEERLKLCERRLVEPNHRVANTLQIASDLIRAQRDRLADLSAKETLTTASARVDAVAQLHWHFCRHGEAQRVDLGRFIEEIAPAIAPATGLACELEVEPFEAPGEAATHLAIAIKELVLNARKHAYGGQDGSQVRIGCRRDPDGRLRLSVADGGRGLCPAALIRAAPKVLACGSSRPPRGSSAASCTQRTIKARASRCCWCSRERQAVGRAREVSSGTIRTVRIGRPHVTIATNTASPGSDDIASGRSRGIESTEGSWSGRQ